MTASQLLTRPVRLVPNTSYSFADPSRKIIDLEKDLLLVYAFPTGEANAQPVFERTDPYVELRRNPENFAERMAISCSMIGGAASLGMRTQTYGPAGIVFVPKEHERPSIASPTDLSFVPKADTLCLYEAKPIEDQLAIFEKTRSTEHNELVYRGKNISHIGGFFRAMTGDGEPISAILGNYAADLADRFGVPLVDVPQNNGFSHWSIRTDPGNSKRVTSCEHGGNLYILYSGGAPVFEVVDQKQYRSLMAPEQLASLTTFLEDSQVSADTLKNLSQDYRKKLADYLAPRIERSPDGEIQSVTICAGFGSARQEVVCTRGESWRIDVAAREENRRYHTLPSFIPRLAFEQEISRKEAQAALREQLEKNTTEGCQEIRIWMDEIG